MKHTELQLGYIWHILQAQALHEPLRGAKAYHELCRLAYLQRVKCYVGKLLYTAAASHLLAKKEGIHPREIYPKRHSRAQYGYCVKKRVAFGRYYLSAAR